MRFINYLNEATAESTMDIIMKECKPFINDWLKTDQRNWLYSGRQISKMFFNREVRKNRKPLDTDKYFHNLLDDEFYKAFGIKARSQTIFCTASRMTAAMYGTPFYIFPVGKYEIIWSDELKDIYYFIPNPKNSAEEYNRRTKFVKELDVSKVYQKGNLSGALKSENEIMVYCNEYYGINANIFKDIWMKNAIEERL